MDDVTLALPPHVGRRRPPIVRSFDIAIDDGRLDIEMPATADNGKLSAVELFGPL